MSDILLGEGREGRVFRRGDEVVKIFKDGVLAEATAQALRGMLHKFGDPFPEDVRLEYCSGQWIARYPFFESEAVTGFNKAEIVDYLIRAAQLEVIADNFKPANLRRRDGRLVYIDIGKHIRPFNRSTFRDVCAKAYLMLGGSSEAFLVADSAKMRASGGVERLPGFSSFYREVVTGVAATFWAKCPRVIRASPDGETSLLIKCCAMDVAYLERQVGHIVHQLSSPRKFQEVVLSIDTKIGSFLRQHASGDLDKVRGIACKLLAQGVVNRVIEAPSDPADIARLHSRWFGLPAAETHTDSGIPVYPQLWAFEQMRTRYVLQADCDVLIWRQDYQHDYLNEMVAAHGPADVMGVGFNIPQRTLSLPSAYDAPKGEYKPEVRLGLFDLERIRTSVPWPNQLVGGRLRYGWYQALHQALGHNKWRCLRGGDPRTAYIHPLNSAKQCAGFLDQVRRCLESGRVQNEQLGKWDLVEKASIWERPEIAHSLILVLEASSAPPAMMERCVISIAGQVDKDFGLIVMEDLDQPARTAALVAMLNMCGLRPYVGTRIDELSLSRRHQQLIVRLKTDEAFMSKDAIVQLKRMALEAGPPQKGCLCESDGLRRSASFGLERMYEGDSSARRCHTPRCFAAEGMEEGKGLGPWPSCAALDVFAETPPPCGNLRPPVMAGFVIWKDIGGPD